MQADVAKSSAGSSGRFHAWGYMLLVRKSLSVHSHRNITDTKMEGTINKTGSLTGLLLPFLQAHAGAHVMVKFIVNNCSRCSSCRCMEGALHMHSSFAGGCIVSYFGVHLKIWHEDARIDRYRYANTNNTKINSYCQIKK